MPTLGIIASSNQQGRAGGDVGSMFPIRAYTVTGSSVASYTFSSIPQTYTHLQLRGIVRCTATGANDYNSMLIACNGDTNSSNYYTHAIYGTGGGAGALSSQSYGGLNFMGGAPKDTNTAGEFGTFIVDLLDYTNTNKMKVARALVGANVDSSTSNVIGLTSSAWFNTSAITSLTISIAYAGNISVNSSFALYGVMA